MNPLYDDLLKEVETDLTQMLEAGHDKELLCRELGAVKAEKSLEKLHDFQQELWTRPSPAGFPYVEPNDWAGISAYFPSDYRIAAFAHRKKELADKLLAAWQGRCAGCQLGKPLEGLMWPDKIESVLRAVASWPLRDYMNPVPLDLDPEQVDGVDFFHKRDINWRNSLCRGNFDHAARDDDLDYALAGMVMLEKHGHDFTTEQALDSLCETLPVSALYAAGKKAAENRLAGLELPAVALSGNPCRQSLGAMIRCDPFGWTAPGNPFLAAAMAYRDAAWSQTRNGIYSGMFFAVLMADVLDHGDIPRAVSTALRYLPPRSRFAEMVYLVGEACAGTDDWQQVNRQIYDKYPDAAGKFNHSIPNAAIVIMGLLLGEGDFSKTLGITVMAGLDTDCTGATAGSIMGCALGTVGIPDYWVAPFNDRIECSLTQFSEIRISEAAKRICKTAIKKL